LRCMAFLPIAYLITSGILPRGAQELAPSISVLPLNDA
jgi:hypothetical protein